MWRSRSGEPTLKAQLDVAQVYENLFVPAEFQEWATRMIAAAQIRSGQRVLDVASGTGVLAREAARCVGPTGFVAGLDLDPGMLAVAARRSPEIEWHQGRAESLPYVDDAFDAVWVDVLPRPAPGSPRNAARAGVSEVHRCRRVGLA